MSELGSKAAYEPKVDQAHNPFKARLSVWWRRNGVFFTRLLPMLLTAAAIGWLSALTWAPRQAVTHVYVVCPASPQQWCAVIHGHIVSRVERP